VHRRVLFSLPLSRKKIRDGTYPGFFMLIGDEKIRVNSGRSSLHRNGAPLPHSSAVQKRQQFHCHSQRSAGAGLETTSAFESTRGERSRLAVPVFSFSLLHTYGILGLLSC
jgi:hypothetical protein